jgi:hypothetical protein
VDSILVGLPRVEILIGIELHNHSIVSAHEVVGLEAPQREGGVNDCCSQLIITEIVLFLLLLQDVLIVKVVLLGVEYGLEYPQLLESLELLRIRIRFKVEYVLAYTYSSLRIHDHQC